MIVASDTFAAVVNYLTSVGGSGCSVMFAPWMDRVHASVKTPTVYAKYEFRPISPLKERFAVPASAIRDIAREMGDSDLHYRKGSQAQFMQETPDRKSKWCISFMEIGDDSGQPRVESVEFCQWDNSIVNHLKLARTAAKRADRNGCYDCVMIEVRASDRVVVATDSSRMVVCRAEIDVDPTIGETKTRFLIAQDQIGHVINTCESGAMVRFRVGYHSIQVECGNRTIVMPQRPGRFRSSWKDSYEAARGSPRSGSVKIDRRRLKSALHHVGSINESSAVYLRSAGKFVEAYAGGERQWSVTLDAPASGKFGPVIVSGGLVNDLIDGWSGKQISFDFLGPGKPVVITDDPPGECLGLIMTMEEVDDDEGET